MADSSNRTMIEREQRYMLSGSPVARVVVLRGVGATPPEVHGTLDNSSSDGVQLCLDDCVPCGESASIRIFFIDAGGEQDGELMLDIEVRWSRPADDGKWTTGCKCRTELSEDVFAMFADRGQIERRHAARRTTQLVAMARWELSLDERPIEITDASRTGFSFRSAKMGSTGDRLMMWLTTIHGEEVTVAAQLQWKAKTDSGYLGGCQLVHMKDHCHLMPFAIEGKTDKAQRDRSQSAGKPAKRRVNMAFAAAVFLLFIGPSIVVLPLLHANRTAGALPASDNEPYEATAEIRLALVDLDSPLADESVTEVMSAPEQTQATDVPAPETSLPTIPETLLPTIPESLPLESEDASEEAPGDDELPVSILTPPPTFTLEPVIDQPNSNELTEPDTKPTADDASDNPAIDNPAIDDVPVVSPIVVEPTTVEPTPDEPTTVETHVEPTVQSATNNAPVEPAPEESRPNEEINEEIISTAPEDEIHPTVTDDAFRTPEPEIVTLEEAIADAPETEPAEDVWAETEPNAAWPVKPEPFELEHLATESFVLEPFSSEPTVSESVIAPRVITPALRRRAAAEFSRGREALAAGNTGEALAAFREAAAANPDVALYQYHWALALHLTDQPAAAIARVAAAARVEHQHEIANWGQLMQRIQGRPRVWLERERRQALTDG